MLRAFTTPALTALVITLAGSGMLGPKR